MYPKITVLCIILSKWACEKYYLAMRQYSLAYHAAAVWRESKGIKMGLIMEKSYIVETPLIDIGTI